MLPWIEKYRIKAINSLKGQDEAINIINKNKTFQHFLFYGPAGTGKTSAIHAFINEYKINKEFILEMNASDDRNIETVRKLIIPFAQRSNNGLKTKRIIILDEADAMTAEAQSALRKIIEDYSKDVMFCLLCNQLGKIIDPIISRCILVEFKPIKSISIYEKLIEIATNENMNLKDDDLKRAIRLIAHYSNGDLRSAIGRLQSIHKINDKEKAVYDSFGLMDRETFQYYYELIQNAKSDIELYQLAVNSAGNQYLLSDYIFRIIKKFPALKISSKIKIILNRYYSGSDEMLLWLELFLIIKSQFI